MQRTFFALVAILISFPWLAPAPALAQSSTSGTFQGSVDAPPFMLFKPTVGDAGARVFFTATLLADGRVLVAGGGDLAINGENPYPPMSSAVLYVPGSGWVATGSMQYARRGHTATLLSDGRVWVEGGCWGWDEDMEWGIIDCPAELYDPANGTWSASSEVGAVQSPLDAEPAPLSLPAAASLAQSSEGCDTRFYLDIHYIPYGCPMPNFIPQGSVVLANGKHLGLYGYYYEDPVGGLPFDAVGIYDEEAQVWRYAGYSMIGGGQDHRPYLSATLLLNGEVLVLSVIQHSCCWFGWNEPVLGTYLPTNTFTGTLSLSTSWVTSTTALVSFSGQTTGCL